MRFTVNNKSEAYAMYKEYMDLNSDLSEQLLNQMVIFTLAARVDKDTLEDLFQREFTSTPYLHRSWWYWKALESSGLASYWDDFTEQYNEEGNITKCLTVLQEKLERQRPKELTTLKRRLMRSELPSGSVKEWRSKTGPSESPQYQWTKGGTWSSSCPMTKILLQNQHLPSRNYWRPYVEQLTSKQLSRLETELYHITDPSTTLAPECKREAVRYVRRRIPEVIGWKDRKMSLYGASWFFQRPIPDDKERWYYYIYDRDRPRPRGPWRDPSRTNDFRWW